MFENPFHHVGQASADADYLDGEPPDLTPLRALAEAAELADAVAGLTDSYSRPLTAHGSHAPLARDIARALVEAGFTLHHCTQHHPLCRLGRVCLLPITQGRDPGDGGAVAVSWTTHDLLSRDWGRWGEYDGVQQTMNAGLGKVLCAIGFRVVPFGQGGAWLVTGCPGHRRQVGR